MADGADQGIWTGLIGLAGPLVMYIVKTWWDDKREARKQAALERRAVDIVKSPEGTNDPMTAVQQAAIEQQMGKLADSARKVRESFAPENVRTASGVPPLEFDVKKVDAFEDEDPTPKLKPTE